MSYSPTYGGTLSICREVRLSTAWAVSFPDFLLSPSDKFGENLADFVLTLLFAWGGADFADIDWLQASMVESFLKEGKTLRCETRSPRAFENQNAR